MTGSFDHVAAALGRLEKIVRGLPLGTLNQVPVDVSMFIEVSRLMRQLPVVAPSKMPQFFNPDTQKTIRALQVKYAGILFEYSKKGYASQTMVEQVFKSVVPNANFTAIVQAIAEKPKVQNVESIAAKLEASKSQSLAAELKSPQEETTSGPTFSMRAVAAAA